MKAVPVSREAHAKKRVLPLVSFHSARAMAVISLFGGEVLRAAHEFPVLLAATAEGFFPAALTGIKAGTNVFVGPDGRWLAGYVPAMFRRAPFLLARVEDRDDWVLCLDETSERLSETEGEPLFEPGGGNADILTRATNLLVQLEQNRRATLEAGDLLNRLGLLTPWRPPGGEGEDDFNGLFQVNEPKFQTLSGADLVALRDIGGLAMIYAQIFSMERLNLMQRLEASRAEAARQRAASEQTTDLDRLFGIVDDEPFQF